ncbi:MAG: AAC(3) family N-acetyltransferase [Deltaproteobacteria bacterium]|nr:AAC(3) family N-acetyltransferase [Deltaproteobacteria bacterium]
MNREELRQLLERLNLRGNHVVVQTSLASLGPIEGGPASLCETLIEAVGPSGTLMMPTFTQTETIRESVPNRNPGAAISHRPIPYHADLPVSPDVGIVAEMFRHMAGVLRSNHPTHSFAAWGRQAREVLSTQRDNNPLGPLKKLNVMQGQVLLLGAPLQAATVIHLAEERASLPYLGRRTALRINAGGYEERVVVENFPGCSVAFDRLDAYLDPNKVHRALLPHGEARKIAVRYLVNLASQVLVNEPRFFICDNPVCVGCASKRAAVGNIPAMQGQG